MMLTAAQAMAGYQDKAEFHRFEIIIIPDG
jgi:hypothetical protein